MTPHAFPRRLAMILLESAISIAPQDTLDWGRAMLGELRHVEGDWSALLWSFGSAGVLAKHALIAMIFPSANRSPIPSGADLFSKEAPMRKPALAVTAACILASLLFFLAPNFRQAFAISLLQWCTVFKTDYRRLDPELESIARKAEQNHDAEALAFVAIRTWNQSEGARLADEAVYLDPNLTWIYAAAARSSSLSEIDRRVRALERLDPENALPHLITAEKNDIDQVLSKKVPKRVSDRPAAWKDAMAAAFQSSKLDTYFARVKALDRRVLLRYHAEDPSLAETDARFYGLPSYGVSDAYNYAELLLASAQVLETQGDRQAASEKYLSIVHFGQLLGPEVSSSFYSEETQKAYTRLAAIAAKSSRNAEAAFYTVLADRERQAADRDSFSWYLTSGANQVARWDADLARRSGFVMLLSVALLFATVFAVVLRSRSLRLSSLLPGRLAVVLGVSSSVTLLVSSVVLRLSYEPYAQIFQRFVHDGDETGLTDLRAFLGHAYAPIGSGWLTPRQDYASYFWLAVIVLCTLGLLLAVLRYFQTRLRSAASA